MKQMRKKVLKETLEKQLEKYERRIQKMAYSAYKVREMIEQINKQEVQQGAVHKTGIETTPIDGSN